MMLLLWLLVFGISWQGIVCPPVHPEVKSIEMGTKQAPPQGEDQGIGLEYDRYLREVMMALEEDESFRKKLEEMNLTDIKSGKIAMHLDLVSHQIRERLDEIKRQEMNRLRMLAIEKMRQMNGIKNTDDTYPHHVDVKNPHSFESKDLEQLIKKATMDLDKIDMKRRDEFKAYELEKEEKHKEELRNLDEKHRKAKEEEYEQMKKRHQDHPQVHHPGSKAQLEDVWEKSDKLDPNDFNPKTFFKMHDLDANGFLDQEEIEALFQKELDQVYDPNLPEDDMRERYEDMSRMREHVFAELDQDKNRLISIDEFLNYTASLGFQKDEGWKTVDEEQNFTDEELKQYEQMRRVHEEQMEQKGVDLSLSQPGMVHQGQGANVQQMQMQQGGLQGAIPIQHQQKMLHNQQPQFQQPQFQQPQFQQPQFQQPQFQQPQFQQPQFQQPQFQQQSLGQMGHMPGQVPPGGALEMGQGGQVLQSQGHLMPQGYVPMGQGQVPPVGKGAPQAHGQIPPQAQVPLQAQGQVPIQAQGQVPPQAQGQVPIQAQGQVLIQAQEQVPLQAQGQVSIQVQGQVPIQAQGQVPLQAQGQVPIQAQGQVPLQAQGQVPIQAQGQVPIQAQGQVLPQAQGQVPIQAQGQVPPQAHVQVPIQAQGQVPIQAQGQVPPQAQGQVPIQAQGQVPLQAQRQVPNQPQNLHQGNIARQPQGNVPIQDGLPPAQEPLRFQRLQQRQWENKPLV